MVDEKKDVKKKKSDLPNDFEKPTPTGLDPASDQPYGTGGEGLPEDFEKPKPTNLDPAAEEAYGEPPKLPDPPNS